MMVDYVLCNELGMTEIYLFILSLIGLVFLLKIITNKESKGVVYFIKCILTLFYVVQLYSIFQYGGEIKGATVKIIFFGDFFINYLHLPNDMIQWLSLVACIYVAACCRPRYLDY